MNKILLNLVLIACFLAGRSQSVKHCMSAEMMNKWMQENPEKAKDFVNIQNEAEEQDQISARNNYALYRLQSAPAYTIPVVFHVLHMNGSENISDAQIMDALSILNTDFRKLNADTTSIVTEFKALAADANFEFRLATKDEFGNCTSGITRHYDARTNWDAGLTNFFTTWDRTKYLNIYVVKNITVGAAGYTYLPGSVPPYADAVVIRHDYVGSIGTSVAYTSRALTHEVGHWFNLQHVWGMTNNPGVTCGNDGVNDTPITKGFGWCNLINPAICSSIINENVQNYMEYSYCTRMFTIGQAARMSTCVSSAVAGRNNLHLVSNLIATGVISPTGLCAPKVDFIADKPEVCVNGTVSFTDLSYNGTVSNWFWKFQDGNGAQSGNQNPSTTFTVSGKKQVFLKVSNSTGSDSVTKYGVTVLAGPGSGTVNITQGFESIVFPNNIWLSNTPAVGGGWIQTNTVGATGNSCVLIDNYYDSPSEAAVFYSPMYDISTLSSPALVFNIAYSQNASNSNDRLRIYYSSDCATTWNTLYSKSGSVLHTVGLGTIASGPFINPLSSQWRKEVVSLSAASSANNLLLKFEFEHDSINPGNNIFLDDINLESGSLVMEGILEQESIQLVPNPATDKVAISFNLTADVMCVIELLNIAGKSIKSYPAGNLIKGGNKLLINTAGLAKGLYFVKIALDNNFYVRKLIID